MPTPTPPRRTLSSRPLDLLYFTFFLTHIPATLLLDLQALYPHALVPAPLARLPELYLAFVPDPLIAGARASDGGPAWVWFRTFLVLEAVFQLPVFCIGLRALWRDANTRTLHVLLLAYAASTATTVLPCLTTLLATPEALLTAAQRALLLAAYVPYLLVPLVMGGDMALRLVAPVPRSGSGAANARVGVKKEE